MFSSCVSEHYILAFFCVHKVGHPLCRSTCTEILLCPFCDWIDYLKIFRKSAEQAKFLEKRP